MDIIDLDHCHVDISTSYPCQQEIKGKPVALHHAGYGDIPSRDANSSLGFMLIWLGGGNWEGTLSKWREHQVGK